MSDEPLVLGIETSCDETGVGIVRGSTLLVDAIASSVDEHARFGGVVPEVASRAHLEAMVATLERACRQADVALSDIDAVAAVPVPERAVRFLAAGGDLVLTASAAQVPSMLTAVKARAASDPAFAAGLERSVQRILALKARFGLVHCS